MIKRAFIKGSFFDFIWFKWYYYINIFLSLIIMWWLDWLFVRTKQELSPESSENIDSSSEEAIEKHEKLSDEKNKLKLEETKWTLESLTSRIDNAKNEKDEQKKGNELVRMYITLDMYQKDIQEITRKSNPRTIGIIRLWESLDQKCDELKWEIMNNSGMDKQKFNEMISQSFSKMNNIDNKEFLKQFTKNERLDKITKPPKDAKDVKSWDDIRFTFTFENKLNENLYLKTTAWQVLPSEVKEVESWWKKYSRTSLEWEFFTKDNERLIIHENTLIHIGELRSKGNNSRLISTGEEGKTYEDDKDSVEYLEKANLEKITEYLKNNPNSDSRIVSGAINRWIDPKFAIITFSDLIKGETDAQKIDVILEDAFTEFDRSRWKVEASKTMEWKKQITEWGKTTEWWRYDENLIINLLKSLFPWLWREKAIANWFSDEEITNYEKISDTKIDFSALDWDVSEMINITWEKLSIDRKLINAILMQESGWTMSATRFEKHVYDREIRKWTSSEEARLLATSFWWFQIMGFNYKTCWYNSVQEFVEAMKSPEEQFNAFSKFVKSNDSLYRAMKKSPPDFQAIAYNYNWSGYAQNRYDKMIEQKFNAA